MRAALDLQVQAGSRAPTGRRFRGGAQPGGTQLLRLTSASVLKADGGLEVLNVAGEVRAVAIDLMLHERLGVAALGVLQQRDEQERDDRRDCVDHELPRIHVGEHEVGAQPHEHERGTRDEEDRTADERGRALREAVEGTPLLAAVGESDGLRRHGPYSDGAAQRIKRVELGRELIDQRMPRELAAQHLEARLVVLELASVGALEPATAVKADPQLADLRDFSAANMAAARSPASATCSRRAALRRAVSSI